jgi:alpha-galactosidase
LRSDYQAANWPGSSTSQMTADVFTGNQGHTYGLSLWLPVFGTGEYCEDLYSVRSHLCPWLTMATNLADPDWDALRREISDQRIASKYFSGDFYPLVEYSLRSDVWMAWQFMRPTEGDGMVQAFRREGAKAVEMKFKLRALKSGAQYEFTDLDTGKKTVHTGQVLMSEGLTVKAKAPRTALILTFHEKQ